MRAGTLRERVELQALVPADDPRWGRTEQYQTADEFWADVEPIRGDEQYAAQHVQGSTGYLIHCRFRSDVKPSARLRWDGRTLDVVSVVNVGNRNRELEITAVEHLSNG